MSEDSDIIRRLAVEQRKRLVASVMQHLETEVFPHLSEAQARATRDKVVGSVNAYHDFILDVLKVNREDSVRNEESLRLIRQVHSSQQRLEHQLRDEEGYPVGG